MTANKRIPVYLPVSLEDEMTSTGMLDKSWRNAIEASVLWTVEHCNDVGAMLSTQRPPGPYRRNTSIVSDWAIDLLSQIKPSGVARSSMVLACITYTLQTCDDLPAALNKAASKDAPAEAGKAAPVIQLLLGPGLYFRASSAASLSGQTPGEWVASLVKRELPEQGGDK